MNNLLKRILSGVVYLAVIICSFLLSKYLFITAILLITTLMMYEFHKMNMGEELPVQKFLSVLTALCFITLVFCVRLYHLDERLVCIAFLPLAALIISVISLSAEDLKKIGPVFTSLVYIGIPMALFPFATFRGYSFRGDILLCMMAIVWMSDIGAYVFGMALGQKYGPKLCPSISPKKSWIGVIGGFFVAVGTAVALGACGVLPYKLIHCIALGAIIDVTGVLGDLVESAWKRSAGVKDSGNIIPGHGGMMDRFDSALLAVPSAVIYLYLVHLL